MCSNRICVSDLSTCGLVISLCLINWAGKEKLDLPDDIVFRRDRDDGMGTQDRTQERHEWKTLDSQTCLLVIFQMFSTASFLYLSFQRKESTVLMSVKTTSIQLLGSFHLPSDGEVSWDFACVRNCFLKHDSYKKYFSVAALLFKTTYTRARTHTRMHT